MDATALGDPFLLGGEFRGVSPGKLTSIFGDDFSKQTATMETGRWQGPADIAAFVAPTQPVHEELPPLAMPQPVLCVSATTPSTFG